MYSHTNSKRCLGIAAPRGGRRGFGQDDRPRQGVRRFDARHPGLSGAFFCLPPRFDRRTRESCANATFAGHGKGIVLKISWLGLATALGDSDRRVGKEVAESVRRVLVVQRQPRRQGILAVSIRTVRLKNIQKHL